MKRHLRIPIILFLALFLISGSAWAFIIIDPGHPTTMIDDGQYFLLSENAGNDNDAVTMRFFRLVPIADAYQPTDGELTDLGIAEYFSIAPANWDLPDETTTSIGYSASSGYGYAPMSKPGSMMLLGGGLIGIASLGRKKLIKKS